MNPQLQISFDSPSPINRERLGGQNRRLYEFLEEGNTIHVFHPAKRRLKIGYLNSRTSDLIHKHGITIYKRRITVKDIEGVDTDVIEYSLHPFPKKLNK